MTVWTSRSVMRLAAAGGLALLCVLLFSSPNLAAKTPTGDAKLVADALKVAKKGKWSLYHKYRRRISDPLLRKVLLWTELKDPGASASFEDISTFIAANPDWPGQWHLQRRAEEAMPPSLSDSRVLAWFNEREPVSVDGRIRYGQALISQGKVEKAREFVVRTWITGNFGPRQERQFYSLYRKFLTREHHEARLDRLLWDDRHKAARRMLKRVGKDLQNLAVARSRLALRLGGVDAAIARVPKHLKDHPGLQYERLRWRRRKGRDKDALALLLSLAPQKDKPAKWWIEREILSRKALKNGSVTDAYRLARDHGLESGAAFAGAEWLAGWIALSFLEDYDVALNHFSNLYGKVSYPISRARAAYWAGRASAALGQRKSAEIWYDIAARFPTTFYGQLAATRMGRGDLKIPPDAKPDAEETDAFEAHELVRVAHRMARIGQNKRIDPFVLRLIELSQSAGWRALAADLALRLDRPDLAVRVSKRSVLEGQPLIAPGYPTLTLPEPRKVKPAKRPEPSLIHALIRQESGFNERAVSRAGARGLMQLMPRTARQVSRKVGLRYSKNRLTSSPTYNTTLGQTYLAGLLDRFDGSYILSLAAYNAGTGRVRSWLKEYGDPRRSDTDPIDWIESIPFSETRNYVQRVMEALQVYRVRLGKTRVALSLERDLHR